MVLNLNQWKNVVSFYQKSGIKFTIFNKGSRTYLLNANGKVKHELVVKKKSNNEELSIGYYKKLLSDVENEVNSFIINNNFCIPSISKDYPVRKKNNLWFSKLNSNDVFLIIDIDHNYWQNAKLLKIISLDTFLKYSSSEYKLYRNVSLSRLTSVRNKHTFFENGKELLISEDRNVYNQLYTYIRHYTNQIIGYILELINHEYYWYNVDCIAVPFHHKQTIIDLFEDIGYYYKINRCVKYDSKHYTAPGGFIKKI